MRLAKAVARKSRTASWRGHALVDCILALALLLAGASWFATTSAAERDRAETSRALAVEVMQTADEIEIAALNLLRGERGFLLTDDPEFLAPMLTAGPRGDKLTRHLGSLVEGDRGQAARARTVAREFGQLRRWTDEIVALRRSGRGESALARVRAGEGRMMIEAIVAELDRITTHEHAVFEARSAIAHEHARANQLYQYLLTAIGLALMVFAGLALLAVRRSVAAEAKIRRELLRRAMTDELTGLANRREFMASLDRAIAAARRNRRPLALAILDIDHFKRVNDTYGHPAGDAVIRTVASTAVDIMRGQDTVGRLGGEEFAIVLPDCSAEDAYFACERLRLAMHEADLMIETGANIFVTVSTGIAVFERDDSAEAMIARADAALYDAKHGGRDRVLLAA